MSDKPESGKRQEMEFPKALLLIFAQSSLFLSMFNNFVFDVKASSSTCSIEQQLCSVRCISLELEKYNMFNLAQRLPQQRG